MPSAQFSYRRITSHLALLFAVAVPALAEAQMPGGSHKMTSDGQQYPIEVRPIVGAYVPTGDQRDQLKDAVMVGGQASWAFHPNFAALATVTWSPTKDRITPGDQKLDLVQYDVGIEGRAWTSLSDWIPRPFAGLGVGGRTFSYRDLNASATTDFDGYGALGADLNGGPIGLRVEARDYVSRFKPLTGTGSNKTRNDLTFAGGITVRF